MSFLQPLFLASLFDLFFGDPRWFPHPVRIMGKVALLAESFTRKLPVNLSIGGMLAVLIVLCSTGGACLALFFMLSYAPPPLFLLGAAFLLYTTLAARDLLTHAKQVVVALAVQDIEQARGRVGMLVGRDTDQLDTTGIVQACVESVAENMSDGIIAPLFWSIVAASFSVFLNGLLGFLGFLGNPIIWGVTAAMLYKAINTMDSMFGYTNERYLVFGSCAARLDDLVNFFPARITGLALVLAALICGYDMKTSFYILKRDRQQHSSPNAGWPEAAMAGALNIQLGGVSSYFGKRSEKPTLGDPLLPPEPHHITQATILVATASLLCLLLFSGCYFLVSFV
ncbi:MAG: cobalamin biosynthesis protein CobD [Candidatus Electrothrix sp. AW3_4]|nr:cobalamin biosynthesis protein CobD [Candidatus Electrothrix gigas]